MNRVTAIIKTFKRPNCLKRLVASIKQFYPDMKIIVADDSPTPTSIEGVEYHQLPFDVGASAGRNFLFNKVSSYYVLLLDDDFIFTDKTKVEEFVRILDENPDLDVLAGKVPACNYYGDMTLEDGVLTRVRKPIEEGKDFRVGTLLPDFFLARSERVKLVKWDESLKINGEHSDFLLQAAKVLKMAYTNKVFIDHKSQSEGDYGKYRGRSFANEFRAKHGIKKEVNFGTVVFGEK